MELLAGLLARRVKSRMESIKIQFKGGEGATADVFVGVFFGHPVAGSLVGVSVLRLERILVKEQVQ